MKPQFDFSKQATSADVEGFINTLTLLLEGNRLSDSTKEILKQTLCNAENTASEGEVTNPENIRAWLASVLNDEGKRVDEEDAFLIFQDEAETQRAINLILKRITEDGLENLATILVNLREMTGEGPEEAKKASDEIGRILELVFRHSRSYKQALRIYTNRHNLIGGGSPDDYINELADRLLKGEAMTAFEE
jgi:hypothetical protein